MFTDFVSKHVYCSRTSKTDDGRARTTHETVEGREHSACNRENEEHRRLFRKVSPHSDYSGMQSTMMHLFASGSKVRVKSVRTAWKNGKITVDLLEIFL